MMIFSLTLIWLRFRESSSFTKQAVTKELISRNIFWYMRDFLESWPNWFDEIFFQVWLNFFLFHTSCTLWRKIFERNYRRIEWILLSHSFAKIRESRPKIFHCFRYWHHSFLNQLYFRECVCNCICSRFFEWIDFT